MSDLMGIGGVYFFSNDCFIKIGKSNNIGRRLREINSRTKYPVESRCIGYVKCEPDRASELERRLHNDFCNFIFRGEWFKIDVNLLKTMVKCSLPNIEATWLTIERDIKVVEEVCDMSNIRVSAKRLHNSIKCGYEASILGNDYKELSETDLFYRLIDKHGEILDEFNKTFNIK